MESENFKCDESLLNNKALVSMQSTTLLLSDDAADQYHQQTVSFGGDCNNVFTDSRSVNAVLTNGKIFATCNETLDEDESKLQGIVLLEDAIYYRSIHHKIDLFSLKLYRWYYSSVVQCSVILATFTILMLAFIEDPSSLSWSTDPRRKQLRFSFPKGVTEGIEIICLLIITASGLIQGLMSTNKNMTKSSFFRENPWLTGGYVVLLISFIDVIISLALGNAVYRIRIRRLFRPYLLAQNTRMLKKTLKAMRNTLPEIASVLTLLSLHLYFFTMLGMLIFNKKDTNGTAAHDDVFNNTEWKLYFNQIDTAVMSLLVLLTTANNPDVMMPSYSENRLYAIYFIVFSLVGTFLIFNLLTAIIYNQFRGYFKSSMQTSYFRRCVALSAAHHALLKLNRNIESSSVSISLVKDVITQVSMTPGQRQLLYISLKALNDEGVSELNLDAFCNLFHDIDSTCQLNRHPSRVAVWSCGAMRLLQRITMSRYFDIAGNLVMMLNAVLMTIEISIHYDKALQTTFSRLNIINYVFVGYYCIEQFLKILSMGKRYITDINCLYDGFVTCALLTFEIVLLTGYGSSESSFDAGSTGLSLWDCARLVNILVLVRLLRIISNVKPMALVTSVLLDIMRNLKSFAGIIVIIYYVFAILGMMAFENTIIPVNGTVKTDYECGTFEQLQYWANNFDDFASALVVLWDVMVVNNWGVFLQAFKKEVSPWSQLYFVAWWLLSSVVCVNLFVALILDHFIAKWENNAREQDTLHWTTIQSLFREQLHEPSPERIREELRKHPSLYQSHAAVN